VHDLRTGVRGIAGGKDAVGSGGQRIGGFGVGEGELVARIVVILVLARVPAGLGETVVGEGLARACDVRHRAVEHTRPLLVGIEALIDQVA
jgi:hypothetical protein